MTITCNTTPRCVAVWCSRATRLYIDQIVSDEDITSTWVLSYYYKSV